MHFRGSLIFIYFDIIVNYYYNIISLFKVNIFDIKYQVVNLI